MVARPRLTRKLHGGIGAGLSVIQAPVGFGKTALLAAFTSEVRDSFNTGWLTLDGSCDTPEVFAEQLAAAVLGNDGFQPPASAEKLDDLRAYLRVVLRRHEQSSALPILLIIDNVHELTGAEGSCELLGWRLESLPDGGEVIHARR